MRISIIIPAHNEEKYLTLCLNSFVGQTFQPNQLIIVDDNSSDNTYKIASEFAEKHDWIKVIQRKSSDEHIPGKKVVDTFDFGLQHVANYDLLGKFDADIILPTNYFEVMRNHFQSNWKLGLCSGLLFIEKDGKWIYENIADKSHVRGPVKLYHKACFKKIRGLRPATGWDTVDTLLARYHDFETLTDHTLQIKHLRHLGQDYMTKNYFAKGEALFKMRYDIVLAKLAALKMAWSMRSPRMYIQIVFGYLNAFFKNAPRFVSKEEGKFIRRLRWKGIKEKIL
ncbi:glycosyltransferase family A protein [Croceitalea sp. MTPC9]|uniref:glycosyltransferase family 2 protein n=1 Tax=unclassified Croceitalea TaxID=2632280 RepID=UPI002B379E33|nr:glycosyltransferase family A protein [Croceitalea sp. MTPC6]GMN17771.1 glycosyltransferase family A protein [Croceitalea sp. MTPC9]